MDGDHACLVRSDATTILPSQDAATAKSIYLTPLDQSLKPVTMATAKSTAGNVRYYWLD